MLSQSFISVSYWLIVYRHSIHLRCLRTACLCFLILSCIFLQLFSISFHPVLNALECWSWHSIWLLYDILFVNSFFRVLNPAWDKTDPDQTLKENRIRVLPKRCMEFIAIDTKISKKRYAISILYFLWFWAWNVDQDVLIGSRSEIFKEPDPSKYLHPICGSSTLPSDWSSKNVVSAWKTPHSAFAILLLL